MNGVYDPYSSTTEVSPTVTTQYVIQLSDGCGTPDVYDSVTVEVYPLPQIEIESTPRTGCEPFEITLENVTDPTQFANWQIGDDYEGSGNTITIDNMVDGSYDVNLVVTAPTGCTSEKTFEDYIIVNPLPEAMFMMTPNPTSIFNPFIQFNDRSSGPIITYQWDFAGLGETEEQNPAFNFPADTGHYPVELMVTTDSGCVDTLVKYLKINSEFNFYVPSAFTPNSDGLNDTFKPEGLGVDLDHYNLEVFDRWGKLVFESNELDIGWDGSIQNESKDANMDVYAWVVTVSPIGSGGKLYTYNGKVSLIR